LSKLRLNELLPNKILQKYDIYSIKSPLIVKKVVFFLRDAVKIFSLGAYMCRTGLFFYILRKFKMTRSAILAALLALALTACGQKEEAAPAADAAPAAEAAPADAAPAADAAAPAEAAPAAEAK
jgi:hypothetical protein